MLTINVPSQELFDENTNEFVNSKGGVLKLEHSLIALSKWESRFHKPYFSEEPKTEEETRYYIECMTINQNVDPDIYNHLTMQNVLDIQRYIEDPHTATIVPKTTKQSRIKQTITSEKIYYWMIACNIPESFEKWHINRLLTLIDLYNYEQQPPKKRSMAEQMSMYRDLNSKRRRLLNSKG